MKMLISALILVTSSIVAGQRPSFAGMRPIGYPDTPNRTTTTPDPLADRFGDGTPERLPIEANGDRDLIDRLSKLPVDKQPFWFINWQAYEQHRKEPQTYPQRPNAFVDALSGGSGSVNNDISTPSSGFIGTLPTAVFNRFGTTTAPSKSSSNVGSSNLNPSGSVYPNSNVYPNTNANLNSNVSPNGNNANYQIYTTENTVYYNGNPTANPNLSQYPNSNANPNNYPTANFNNNPTGSSNPSGNLNSSFNTQSSKFIAQTNSGTTKTGFSYFQTTQKYQWNTAFKSTNVGTTNLNQNPEYYPKTETYPQRSGHELF